jgi:thiol-disulfide isomerase/thioredoxin
MSFANLTKLHAIGILYFIFSGFYVRGQYTIKEFPKIGDTIPSFKLNDLHYFAKKKARSADFKGKPMILDFFGLGCESCFRSFPEVNALKKEFEGRIQFILVGKTAPGIQKQYENYRKYYNLDLPVDYDDSTIWNQFGVLLVPYTVWIDADGVIRQLTISSALSSNRLNDFIQGKRLSLSVTVNQKDSEQRTGSDKYFYDYRKPFLVGGNGGADSSFLYRSVLCNWDYRSYFWSDRYISSKNKNRVQEIGVGLNALFNLAYGDTVPFLYPLFLRDVDSLPNHYGQWAANPLVESSRSSLFNFDPYSPKNVYSYALIIPDSNLSAKKLQQMMQRDLKNYFSMYATVEVRKMPCWKIIASENAEKMLKTRGGEPAWTDSPSDFSLQNQPVNSLLVQIWGLFQNEPIFVDETNITYNIDLIIHAILSDMNDIKKELQKYGLDLVRAEKDMKTIVIRDLSY